MKRLFILGAGASRELEFSSSTLNINSIKQRKHSIKGPLSKGFFYSARECVVEIKKLSHLPFEGRILNKWLTKFIEQYYLQKNAIEIKLEEIFIDKSKSDLINIESLYIAIEDEIGDGNQLDDKEFIRAESGKRALLEYIHNVFAAISYYFYSKLHRILANYILNSGGDIISFNWDILIEEELYDNGQWDYYDGYGFEPEGIIDKNKKMSEEYQYKPKVIASKNLVLKPHGSINWYERTINSGEGATIYLGIPLTRKKAFRGGTTFYKGRLRYHECNLQKGDHYRSLIMPPGRKRTANEFILEKMQELLKDSDEIITIGFSFNDFDRHISDFFEQLNYKQDLKVKIINPESDIVDKYKKIFKSSNIIRIFNSFSEYCAWLVQQEGIQKFTSLLD